MKKRGLSLFLSVCMIFSMLLGFTLPVSAGISEAAITVEINDKSVNGSDISEALAKAHTDIDEISSIKITEGEVTVTDWVYLADCSTSFSALKSLTVSAAVYTVADIPNASLTTSVFPASLENVDIARVRSIGAYALNGCNSLTSAALPQLTSIGEGTFNGCTSLAALKLPAVPPAVVGTAAFAGCPKSRKLGFIDASGAELTGDGLIAAQNAYKTAEDGDITDNYWYGWTIVPTAVSYLSLSTGILSTPGTSGDFTYETTDGKATITKYSGTASNVTIPYWFGDNLVVAIADGAFSDCTGLQNIYFETSNAVTSIGAGAFSGCTGLQNISFPTGVTSVADNMFKGCTSLETVAFPGATAIGNDVFFGCTKLKTIKLPATPPSVSKNPFTEYPEDISISFINEDKELTGDELSEAQRNYQSAYDGNINDNLWNGITFFSVSIKGTPQVGKSLEAVVKLSGSTVNYQWKANGVNIGTESSYKVQPTDIGKKITVTVNATGSFEYTIITGETAEVIPAVISGKINNGQELYADSLVELLISAGFGDEISSIEITGGNITANDWTAVFYAPYLKHFKVDDTVDNVADITGYFPKSVQTIDIPKVKVIGKDLFKDCPNLTRVSFPDVTTIGAGAFCGCKSLPEAVFPEVTSIADGGFEGCSGLESISFPKLTSMGTGAFSCCARLTEITDIIFPNLESIPKSAFSNCAKLTDVVFSKIESIDDSTFNNCVNLNTVTFPEATSIGNSAFSSCKSLTDISFPKVTSIGEGAFGYCYSFVDATFSEVTSIGKSAFENCINLKTVSFPKALIIEEKAFKDLKRLTDIYFPEVTTIRDTAFGTCKGLETVNFPKVKEIGNHAFLNCTNLKTATFPVVQSINLSFGSCARLGTLKLPAVPPTISTSYNYAFASRDGYIPQPADRKLIFVDSSGTALTGAALTAAQNDYQTDGAKYYPYYEDFWCGWDILN